MNCEKCNREIDRAKPPVASEENLERVGIIPAKGATYCGIVAWIDRLHVPYVTCDNCWTLEHKAGITQLTRATLPEAIQPKSNESTP